MSASSDGWNIPLKMSAEIEQAGAQGAVALTSTPLLLHPRGIEYATECIARCRAYGVIAAFVVMIDGVLWIGASIEQLQRVTDQIADEHSNRQAPATDAPAAAPPQPYPAAPNLPVTKSPLTAQAHHTIAITARNIPLAMQHGWSGGMQVAATAAMAHLAGMRACAAATIELDDLYELARHPLAVVSAGIGGGNDVESGRNIGTDSRRADSDTGTVIHTAADSSNTASAAIGKGVVGGSPSASSLTMARALASYQLPLIGYRCESLPPFSHGGDGDSGVPASGRVEQAAEIAKLLQIARLLNRQSALLVAHPTPPFSARAREIRGKAANPPPIDSGELAAAATHGSGALAEAQLDALLQSAELSAEIVALIIGKHLRTKKIISTA